MSVKLLEFARNALRRGSHSGLTAVVAGLAVFVGCTAQAATKTIDAGTVYTNSASYLAGGTSIVVPDGAAFDFRTVRNSTWYDYQYAITIAGSGPDGLGALRDTGTHDPKGDDPQIASMTLTGDALIRSSRYMALLAKQYGGTKINLNSHTLTIDMATGKSFALFHAGPWNAKGTLKLVNGIFSVPRAKNGNTYYSSDFESATVAVEGPNSVLSVDGDGAGLYVKHLLMSDGAKLVGNGFIGINGGIFKPSEENSAFTGILRLWGNITIDLSGLSGTWTFPAHDFYKCTASTVTLKVAPWAKEGVAGNKLIGWDAPPLSVTFKLDTALPEGWRMVIRHDGLYLYPTDFPYYAVYVSGKSSWEFYTLDWVDVTATCGLAEPTAEQAVCFSSVAEYEALKQLAFSAHEVLMRSCVLGADATLTGLAFAIDADATVDVAGHKLSVPASVATRSIGGTVTSSAAGGVFDLNVPSGETNVVSWLYITGGNKLQLWKTGGGRLSMEKAGQSFGENGVVSCVVKEGVLAKKNATSKYFGAQYSTVRVEDGAQVDIMGGGYWDYDYSIAGDGPDGKGAIVCGETKGDFYAKSTAYAHLRDIVLDGDAAIGGDKMWALSFYNNGAHNITFNGHTLTIGKNTFVYWITLNPQDGGKLDVGNVEVYQASANLANVDVEVEKCLASNSGNFFNPVKSLKYGPEARWYAYGSEDSPTTVYETYRPGRGTMPTVTLGAAGHLAPTLDLSTQTQILNGAKLRFADGAAVTVAFGERKLKSREKVVDWTGSAPPNLATLTFRGTCADGRTMPLTKNDDGLYVSFMGTMILVR